MAKKLTRRIRLSVDPSSQAGIQNGGSLYQNGACTSARGDSLMNTLK